MKRRSVCAGALALAVAFSLAGFACSSDAPSTGAPLTDASAPEVYDVCTAYTKIGDPCPIASGRVCFPVCRTGGCQCTATPNGSVWTCKTDLSCFPDAAPGFDGGEVAPVDGAGGEDAAPVGSDSGATDSGDAGVTDSGDAAHDG